MLTDIDKKLLQEVAGLHEIPQGAYNIRKNGEGVQHIAVRVENIETALAELKEKGVRMIDETPRYGAGGARIAFVHPKSTKGVLLELCERGGVY